MLSDDDWRSEERYSGLSGASPSDLAWEFLRRNPDYQRDFESVGSRRAFSAEPGTKVDPIRRWGLTFSGRPGAVGGRAGDLLAA